MFMDNIQGFSLNSQEIREKIAKGFIITPNISIEDRIQPASFDPVIGDEIFILESEVAGLFRPGKNETVYRTLLQLPKRYRQRHSMEEFEIKKGFTYLIPLEDRIKITEEENVRSSPKSSIGRVFINTRLLTDYNVCFDEINPAYKTNEFLRSWLLVQPLALNAILHSGISLNQLRFFHGLDAQLNTKETKDELSKDNLLYLRNEDESFTPSDLFLTDGIQVHLDLTGSHTDGIVGLRVRHNPNPIDLGRIESYEAEDFFEPIIRKNGVVEIKRGEYYLFASKEVLKIPGHLNAELKRTSHIGLIGDIHFAGFIDPGFAGDLVLEIRSHEIGNVALTEDNIPISNIHLFRNKKPDKLYGVNIGSHYNGQLGSKPAKYFKKFDYKFAARDYGKLSRLVLTQDTKVLLNRRKNKSGFEFIERDNVIPTIHDVQEGFFHFRYDCEFDEDVLQVIPYVLIFDKDKRIFSYVRANNIEDYGDRRLFGKHSIGVGGYIIQIDGSDYVRNGLERELREEVDITWRRSDPKLLGTLMAYDVPVDGVHFGLVYSLHCDSVKQKESSMHSGRLVCIEDLLKDPSIDEKYETWSRILIPRLQDLAAI